MRFAFIHAEKAYFPLMALCRLLGVSRQGYYRFAKRPAPVRVWSKKRPCASKFARCTRKVPSAMGARECSASCIGRGSAPANGGWSERCEAWASELDRPGTFA